MNSHDKPPELVQQRLTTSSTSRSHSLGSVPIMNNSHQEDIEDQDVLEEEQIYQVEEVDEDDEQVSERKPSPSHDMRRGGFMAEMADVDVETCDPHQRQHQTLSQKQEYDGEHMPPLKRKRVSPMKAKYSRSSDLPEGFDPSYGMTRKVPRSDATVYTVNSGDPPIISENTTKEGRPIFRHPSGVMFPLPYSCEGHIIKLSDSIPENPADDILKEDEGFPYCHLCHAVIKTWRGFEYHMMKEHVKYRPYRCLYCLKEFFYTEDEVQNHTKAMHPTQKFIIMKEVEPDKEKYAEEMFSSTFLMVREGRSLTQSRRDDIEKAAYTHQQKFSRLRFKKPELVARQRVTMNHYTQTNVTMALPGTMIATQKSYGMNQMAHSSHSHGGHSQHTHPVKIMRLTPNELAQLESGAGRYLMERADLQMDPNSPGGELIEVDIEHDVHEEEVVDQEDQDEHDPNAQYVLS